MVTVEQIKAGMGLEEILSRQMPDTIYGALKSAVPGQVSQALDPTTAKSIDPLISLLIKGSKDDAVIASAVEAALYNLSVDLDNVIAADLLAQQQFRDNQETIDLTSQILPSEVQTPDLLEMVTTDEFKQIVGSESVS